MNFSPPPPSILTIYKYNNVCKINIRSSNNLIIFIYQEREKARENYYYFVTFEILFEKFVYSPLIVFNFFDFMYLLYIPLHTHTHKKMSIIQCKKDHTTIYDRSTQAS